MRGSVTFIDPRNGTSYMEASSDLSFANTDGKVLPLTTYGMFDMDFRDDEMNELNVAKVHFFIVLTILYSAVSNRLRFSVTKI